jgi:hypothetical protein
MRVQDPSLTLRLLKLKSLTPKPLNPCPVCGAETSLAEIEPHPLHIKFEIHVTPVASAGRSNPWSCFVHRWILGTD